MFDSEDGVGVRQFSRASTAGVSEPGLTSAVTVATWVVDQLAAAGLRGSDTPRAESLPRISRRLRSPSILVAGSAHRVGWRRRCSTSTPAEAQVMPGIG